MIIIMICIVCLNMNSLVEIKKKYLYWNNPKILLILILQIFYKNKNLKPSQPMFLNMMVSK